MAAPRDILILGGTGFLGPHIVESARARGHRVTLFNRGQSNPHLFPDVEQVHGDRERDLDALKGRTWDAVVDPSGYLPRIVKTSADFLAAGVGQYIFISSISVYKDLTPGADEAHPLRALSEPGSEEVLKHYGALKALCERVVSAAFEDRALIIRPGLIVGPGDPTDRFTYWPVRIDRGGEILAPGNGDDPAQVIDGRDLAAWILSCVEQNLTGTFNATGPRDAVTMRDLLSQCQAGVGVTARFTWVDTDFLKANEVEPWSDLPVWTGSDSGILSASIARALDHGLAFRPLAETARDTLAWWKALPPERRQELKAGLKPEREAEMLAAWHGRNARRAAPAVEQEA